MVKNNQPTYYHKDHLGSSTVMTNHTGVITESAMYLPYGGKRGEEAISTTGYQFTDQELDSESGLYNYDARLYDPVIGRFVTPDTLVPSLYNSQSFDRYAYALNDPLKYTDPDGHFVACAVAIGYGLTEAAISLGALTAAAVVGDWLGSVITKSMSDDSTDPSDQDVSDEENSIDSRPDEPPPNYGKAKPHGNPDHDEFIDNRIDELSADENVSNVRKNQQQTDVNGKKVSKLRLDIQYDRDYPDSGDKKHHNEEADRSKTKSDKHLDKLRKHDPDAINTGHVLGSGTSGSRRSGRHKSLDKGARDHSLNKGGRDHNSKN